MREWLSLTRIVEILSIITGVGVVISAVVYAAIFSSFGLSYIGMASLADVLRDSLKLLILFIAVIISSTSLAIIISLSWPPMSRRKRLFLSGVFAVSAALFAFALPYLLRAFSGISVPELSLKKAIIPAILFVTAWPFLADLLRYRKEDTRGSRFRFSWANRMDRLILMFSAAFMAAGSTTVVSLMLSEQMRNGLPMPVELGDVKSCKDQGYTAVWLGDSKAVVKCDKSGLYVVKAL